MKPPAPSLLSTFGGRLPIAAFLLCAIAIAASYLLSPYPFSDDDVAHWAMARYADAHPSLFVNIWGRPGFTLLHWFPAQFGFDGSRVLSALLTLLTGILVALAVPARHDATRAMAMIFVVFQTHVFQLADGALTETVYACALAAGLLAYVRGRLALAALAFSWTAITRLEGMPLLLIPAVALAIDSRRKGATLGRMAAMTIALGIFPVLWNLAYVLIEPTWNLVPILSSNRFLGAARGIYGSGEWWSFAARSPLIHGPVIWGLAVIGLVAGRGLRGHALATILLVATHLLHATLWAFGLFKTGGYDRFFAAVAPAVAYLGAMGFDHLLDRVRSTNRRRLIIVLSILISIASAVFFDRRHHRESDDKYAAVASAITALGETRDAMAGGARIFTKGPYPAMLLGLDPWDRDHVGPFRETSVEHAPAGSIVLWSGHAPDREPSGIDITRFQPMSAAAELARDQGRNWIHLLDATRPDYQLVADRSRLFRPGRSLESEPWPYYVRVYRKISDSRPRESSGGSSGRAPSPRPPG